VSVRLNGVTLPRQKKDFRMAAIQVFNTLTGKKEAFVPFSGEAVNIYACGVTVYDSSHLGHARMLVVWDVIQRYLRYAGYNVAFARNITDVDDKIINRAKDRGIPPEQLTRLYVYEFWRDMDALNIKQPDFEPRATEFIAKMLTFAEDLIKKGYAYAVDGDVYFEVAKFKEYGKLSKQDLDQLMTGMREQVRSQDDLKAVKRNPVDFALWKRANPQDLGWDSPWGHGRPGWHLECSTMIKALFGESIDIHGGGEDLVFPHHENEIAQSEALHGKPLAKYWMHNGFVQVSGEKMAKSVGNFKTIQDLLQNFSPDTLRLLLLQTHYRNPIDFTADSLAAAKTAAARLARAASYDQSLILNGDNGGGAQHQAPSGATGSRSQELPATGSEQFSDHPDIAALRHEFEEAMNNDFNTAIALSVLFAFADKVQQVDEQSRPAYARELRRYAAVLGLQLEDTRRVIDTGTAARVVDLMLELRQSARAKKDYATSDLIRKQLTDLNINVMDTGSGGASWEKL
jgi:cysteinyl-tRNA synthetase